MNDDLMESCRFILEGLPECKDEVGLSDEELADYLKLLENLKPADVSKVLEVALKIQSSNIKDIDLKNKASVLIRAMEEC